MRIKEGFILREVADAYVAVAVGDTANEFNGLVNLNETGAFIWKQLENDTTREKIAEAITNEYDIDKETALKSAEGFIAKLREAGLLAE